MHATRRWAWVGVLVVGFGLFAAVREALLSLVPLGRSAHRLAHGAARPAPGFLVR